MERRRFSPCVTFLHVSSLVCALWLVDFGTKSWPIQREINGICFLNADILLLKLKLFDVYLSFG
jgi:hypothetical protein